MSPSQKDFLGMRIIGKWMRSLVHLITYGALAEL
jgi:hypothetical protein